MAGDMKQSQHGRTVLVAGGSSGLGKDIAKCLVAEGISKLVIGLYTAISSLDCGNCANVYILARRQTLLNDALREILTVRKSPATQEIRAVSVDLANPTNVSRALDALPRVPDAVYCCAGGTSVEAGFFTDISPSHINSCMQNNYFSAAYITQHALKTWIAEDNDTNQTHTMKRRHRQIVFVASAAAFVGIPAYGAFAASKCATRALADTLRMECLRLSSRTSLYTVHIAFPSNFITPSFLASQHHKPLLCKDIEGTNRSEAELVKKFPSSATVARKIVRRVATGDYAICDDSMASALLFANMIGPSPRRGLGIWDALVSVVMGLVLFPILRRVWDQMCTKDGERWRSDKRRNGEDMV